MKLLRNTVLPAILLCTSPALWAKTCAVTISANDQMKFDQETIKIAAECPTSNLTLTHTGKRSARVMGHNWVLTKTTDMQAVAQAGLHATLADNYVPKADPRDRPYRHHRRRRAHQHHLPNQHTQQKRLLHLFLLISRPLGTDERNTEFRRINNTCGSTTEEPSPSAGSYKGQSLSTELHFRKRTDHGDNRTSTHTPRRYTADAQRRNATTVMTMQMRF